MEDKPMNNVIDRFEGENYYLSNFYMCDVTYNGIEYKHTEGAFQAQKSLNEQDRKYVASLHNPSLAKKVCGRHGSIKLRPDWEEVKDQIMDEILMAKFTQNPKLKEKLLATGEAKLIEGNTWHDNYWGNCTCSRCRHIEGRNQLGKTLMSIREELRSEVK